MKKFYVLIVVIICFAAQGFSQTYTWVGGATGSWSTPANWSPATVPNSGTADVVFNTNVTVNLSEDLTVKSISVNGANDVRISGTEAFETIVVESSNATPPSVIVNETTGILRLFQMTMICPNKISGTINGSLILEGDELDFGQLVFPDTAGQTAEFNINGTLIDEYGSSIINPNDEYLNFNAGSKFILSGTTPYITPANYSPSSEIIFTGVINKSIAFEELQEVGTITYNCPSQAAEILLNLPTRLIIRGSLNIQNTNGQNIILLSNTERDVAPQIEFKFTVDGDLNITGGNSTKVSLAKNFEDYSVYSATINGNFLMSGNSFSLQNTSVDSIQPTTLFVKGNINHTAGTITALSADTAISFSLFNIEMNGTAAQTITSTPQSFNNTGNQVALRISNSTNGVTLLTPLEVGMLGFSSNGKLITDETNFVKVMNPSTEDYVVSGSGFVQGPVRRATNSTSEYKFPTGAGTTARYVSVFPDATTGTTYQASYTNASPANTTVNSPLTNIVNYYWEVDRISSGANAAIEITLPGAVSGATMSDALIVAKSSGGANWERSIHPSFHQFLVGDATSGTIRSAVQTSFSSFTIGWAPMSAALPIDLLSFTVNKSGSKANLNWKVTSSSTPKTFDVMKSSDGVNFSKIGTVSGLTAKLSYDFTDNNLLAGNNYYRLKMLDIDGTVSYSNIIVAVNGVSGTTITSMMPTMVIDRARLNISSVSKGNMQLVITDINGRIIQTQNASINAGNQEIWINATRLATGYFQITGYINGEKTKTIRFFKR